MVYIVPYRGWKHHIFLLRMNLYVYFMETPKFAVTINKRLQQYFYHVKHLWLLVSNFTVWNPKVINLKLS